MHYNPLGQDELEVSAIGLGTMTFGNQNTQAQAHAQLDVAIAAGVNFLDTAEMYPFPSTERDQGDSERIIGSWVKKRGNRDKLIIASKVSGPGEDWLTWIRGGHTHLDRANIEAAIEGSLERLQTDYIDLYQLHWPDRHANYFGRLGYEHRPGEDATRAYLELAQENNISLAQMSIAYVIGRPFVTSTLVTATNLEQLAEDLSCIDRALSQNVVDGIELIHGARPNSCP